MFHNNEKIRLKSKHFCVSYFIRGQNMFKGLVEKRKFYWHEDKRNRKQNT